MLRLTQDTSSLLSEDKTRIFYLSYLFIYNPNIQLIWDLRWALKFEKFINSKRKSFENAIIHKGMKNESDADILKPDKFWCIFFRCGKTAVSRAFGSWNAKFFNSKREVASKREMAFKCWSQIGETNVFRKNLRNSLTCGFPNFSNSTSTDINNFRKM